MTTTVRTTTTVTGTTRVTRLGLLVPPGKKDVGTGVRGVPVTASEVRKFPAPCPGRVAVGVREGVGVRLGVRVIVGV
jgi:hypothetical protein